MGNTGYDQRLDVRKLDEPPFDPIMQALDGLTEGEQLLLISSFEPKPLYQVLSGRGYDFETEQVGDDEWHVIIWEE